MSRLCEPFILDVSHFKLVTVISDLETLLGERTQRHYILNAYCQLTGSETKYSPATDFRIGLYLGDIAYDIL